MIRSQRQGGSPSRDRDPLPHDARMWIEIDQDADPIGGVVHEDGRPSVPFHGWLQFAAALDQLRTPPEGAAEQPADGARGR